METILFYFLAAVVVTTALVTVTRTNPIASALALVAAFAAQAALFALLSARLVAVIQILVYAGGILVLILFVLMLLDLHPEELRPLAPRPLAAGFLLFGVLGFAVLPVVLVLAPSAPPAFPPPPPGFGGLADVGTSLFSRYLFPFEMLSILLLAAVVGALVLAKRRL